MAASAENGPKKSVPMRYGPTTRSLVEASVVGKPTNSREQLTTVQIRAARMFAQGKPIRLIAKKLADYVCPHEADRQMQLKKTRTRIRSWARSEKFRAAIYEEALMRVDLRTGEILDGVVERAIAGRVDAARLALEVTGRHSPHTEITPSSVNIIFDGVPRPPSPRRIGDGEIVDVDAEVEPDDSDGS